MSAIKVSVIGSLRQCLTSEIQARPGQTVADVVKGLPLRASGAILALVNGRVAAWDQVLQAGDELTLVPGVSGGL